MPMFRRRARSYGVRRRFKSRMRPFRSRMRARSMGRRFKRRKSSFPQRMKKTTSTVKHFNSVPVLAPKRRVKHRWALVAQPLNPAGGTNFVQKRYRLDNLYDPDPNSITGQSSAGYNLLSFTYQKYCVIAVAVTVRFFSADDSNAQYVALRPYDVVAPASPDYAIQDVITNGRTIVGILQARDVAGPTTLRYMCSPPKFFNQSNPLEENLNYLTGSSTSYLEIEVLCASTNGSTSGGCWFDIEIDSIAIWNQPVEERVS